MYTRAKKILASEFMYALDKDEEGAEESLDGLLEERYAATANRLAVQQSPRSSRPPAPGSASEPAARRPSGRSRDGRWSSGSLEAFRACDSVPARSSSPRPPGATIGDLGGHDSSPSSSGGATRAQVRGQRPWRRSGPSTSRSTTPPGRLLTPELLEALVADLDAAPEAAGTIAARPGRRHDQAGWVIEWSVEHQYGAESTTRDRSDGGSLRALGSADGRRSSARPRCGRRWPPPSGRRRRPKRRCWSSGTGGRC